jgi:hypothetical protein
MSSDFNSSDEILSLLEWPTFMSGAREVCDAKSKCDFFIGALIGCDKNAHALIDSGISFFCIASVSKDIRELIEAHAVIFLFKMPKV